MYGFLGNQDVQWYVPSVMSAENAIVMDSPDHYSLTSFAQDAPKREPVPDAPRELAHDYEILGLAGKGTQGHVFRARDRKSGRIVAIKQLRIASVANWKEYDLFSREARVLGSLDIPGVARFYEARECLDAVPPSAYIVQEFIEGTTLAAMLREGKRLPVSQIHSILVQCLEILQKLHEHDPVIIHRDIKPSNLILTPEGRVYLIDFGAVANPQVQGGGSTVAGTYGYMPPEQMMGRPVPESDIYSLAATAVHLFSGVAPEAMDNADFHLLFEPHMQSMPSALIYTLRAMLDPDVKRRFCDIPELIRIFAAFRDDNYDIPLPIAKLQNDLAMQDAQDGRTWAQKLAEVREINAPGNFDLWHQLPNQTPRDIPRGYQNPAGSDAMSSLATMGFGRDWLSNRIMHLVSPFALGALVMVMFCLWLGILILLFGLLRLLPEYLLFVLCPFVITGGSIILYSALKKLFLYIKNAGSRLYPNVFRHAGDAAGSENRECEDVRRRFISASQYRDIIQNGEKTLATITDIRYVPQPDGLYKCDFMHGNAMQSRVVQVKAPLFCIQYRFNPDDDENPHDLYHEIFTRTPPEDHYRIGDALPILYLVGRDKDGRPSGTVYSTPFPLPMHGSLSLGEVVGYSVAIGPQFS